ncbi:MAG: hypothetical protein HOJ35_12425 [Bdellovibrionales bacterium]|nr:hypothetical protein [Bdellovibrionales bacterium]
MKNIFNLLLDQYFELFPLGNNLDSHDLIITTEEFETSFQNQKSIVTKNENQKINKSILTKLKIVQVESQSFFQSNRETSPKITLEVSNEGIYILPLKINNYLLYIITIYHQSLNPALIKANSRKVSEQIIRFLNAKISILPKEQREPKISHGNISKVISFSKEESKIKEEESHDLSDDIEEISSNQPDIFKTNIKLSFNKKSKHNTTHNKMMGMTSLTDQIHGGSNDLANLYLNTQDKQQRQNPFVDMSKKKEEKKEQYPNPFRTESISVESPRSSSKKRFSRKKKAI